MGILSRNNIDTLKVVVHTNFIKQTIISHLLGFLDETLLILVAQGASKLPAVKVEDKEK